MASTYIYNSNPTAGNRTKGTISVWFKRSGISSSQYLYSERYNNNNMGFIELKSNDQLNFQSLDGGNTQVQIQTNRVFRDTNSWYHLVAAWDTTNSTVADRVKIYINGVRETSFAVNSPPNTSISLYFGVGSSNYPMYIGRRGDDANYFDGSMSHFHRVDNQQLAQTVFGSSDSTTGEWKINISPSITYTGSSSFNFFILKDGNSVTDQSGQSNNLTVGGGTLTKTEDCPSNVFATLNPLQEPFASQTAEFSFGNTKVSGNDADWQRAYGTIGAKQGKWFYEFKNLQDDGYTSQCRIGWDSIDNINDGIDNYYSGLYIDRAGKLRGGIKGYNGYSPNAVQMTAAYSGGNFSFTANDILGMAIDLDNETFSVYKNGNLEINAYSYAGVSNNSLSKSRGFFIAPSYNWYSSSGNNNRSCFNFGNGYFETTAISSAGTNASGIGLFEYDVPANYTAWSTKGLNL